MTLDEQEALSRRYGLSAFMVLPLKSGHIAILGHARALFAIVDTWEEAKAAGARLEQIMREESERRRPKPRAKVEINLKDLGL